MGFIRHNLLIAVVLVMVPAIAQEPPPTFKVDVRLVRMLVTVKNAQGQLVGGLDPKEFRVFDNDVPQEITLFERRTEQPLSVSLLVDTSRSTERERRYEIDSVQRFLRRLLKEGRDDDTVALYGFNTEVTLFTPPTNKLSRVESGLRSLKSEGATSLYDAIYLATRNMNDVPGRHVVLVVSDGGDTASKVKFHEALEALHAADAVLYSVLVVPVKGDPGRNLRGENALFTFAQWTGGKQFVPALGAGLDDAFEEILLDLRTQYLLGFYSRDVPPTTERFHRVRVDVTRPAHNVSARNGYYSDEILESPATSGPRRPK